MLTPINQILYRYLFSVSLFDTTFTGVFVINKRVRRYFELSVTGKNYIYYHIYP